MIQLIIYCLASIGCGHILTWIPAVVKLRKKARRAALMKRIFRLELDSGLGLMVAREWFEKQPLRTKDQNYSMIGQWYCYGCERWHEAMGHGFHKLCNRWTTQERLGANH